jgi:pilus assembly protein CpaB
MIFRIGIFGVLIAALIGVMVFAYSILNQPKPVVHVAAPGAPVQTVVAAPPPTEQILTAAVALPGGSLLKPTDLGSTTIMTTAQVPGEVVDTAPNRSSMVGSMLRVAVTPGAPIMDNEVIHPGDHGFLAAVLPPGMRAVTIAVDTLTGANGLIWPGDNVDVLMTQTMQNAPDAKSVAAVVVLSDIRVIATGDALVKNATDGPGSGSVGTVTLEVTPEQASRCIVATNLGRLYLIVHSAQGTPDADKRQPPPPPVYAGDVSQAPVALSTVTVITSGGTSKEFKF